ncbi:unnamed protein product [Rotaria socialis]|nr:unnamed protein product [Rotaria socialis]CAF3448594.1 unnamed protein product [Rotaria socialis]CAF3477734.1 unnamed protein product [Rotaria socialis]CAF3781920.1 unnamed protein product [Rotaria socialis]
MSKNTKRQKKLEDMMGSSSTKKRKENNDHASTVSKQIVVDTSTTSTTVKKISEDDLEVLKQFDLDMTFGPCTGIPRIDRYERALRHDVNPPIRVLELIDLYPNDRQVTHCIWRDYTL